MNKNIRTLVLPLCLMTAFQANAEENKAPSENMNRYTLEERVAMTIGYDLANSIKSGLTEMKAMGEKIQEERVIQGVTDYLTNPESVDIAEAERVIDAYYESLRKKEILYNFDEYTGQIHHVRDEVSKCFAEYGIDGYDNCVNGKKGENYYIPGATEFTTDLVKSTEVIVHGKNEGAAADGDINIYSVKLTVNEGAFDKPYNVIYDAFWSKSGELYWRFNEKSTCYEANLCRRL